MSDQSHRRRALSPAEERNLREALKGWASALGDVPRLRLFMDAVAEAMDQRGEQYRLTLGQVTLPGDDGKWDLHWGLANLSQLCAAAPPAQWPQIITDHFDLMARTHIGPDDHADLAALKDQLVVRLWESAEIHQASPELIERDDIPGLSSVLAIDLPETLITVRAADTRAWGVDPLALFDLAIDQALALSPVQLEGFEPGEGAEPLWILQGGSIYTATHALRLAQRPELLGRRGAVVALPTRHLVIGARFDSVAVVGAINALISLVQGAYRDGPGSLTQRLYWFEPGRWIEIPYTVTRREVSVTPPDALVEALNQLAESEDPTASL